MLQGYTMAIVPCGNPTPKKLPTSGGEWPTFRTARARRVHSARTARGTPPYSPPICIPWMAQSLWKNNGPHWKHLRGRPTINQHRPEDSPKTAIFGH